MTGWTWGQASLYKHFLSTSRPGGSLSNIDSDGYENVTYKVKSRCFKLYIAYSTSFNSSNVGNFYWSWILTEFRERKSNSLPCVHDLHKTNANMFSLHFWPLQFYIWLNAVTAVSAFGFKLKEFPWFLPRFSLKVLLPEVFLNIFSAAEGFQVILPVIEDSQSKSRTIFSSSPNRWLRNLELSKSRLRKFWTKQIKKENVDDSVSTCCVLWLAI